MDNKLFDKQICRQRAEQDQRLSFLATNVKRLIVERPDVFNEVRAFLETSPAPHDTARASFTAFADISIELFHVAARAGFQQAMLEDAAAFLEENEDEKMET